MACMIRARVHAWLCLALVLVPAGSAAPADDARPVGTDERTPDAETRPLADGLYASFLTNRGEIVAALEPQHAPLTVSNFVGLAEGTIPFENRPAGAPFYDGLIFHRVVEGFVVQGGDPLGTGEGGPGYEFADEFSPRLKHDAAGVLAMANSGPATNGSQFYFTLNPVHRLNYKHAVFGKVVRGLEILPRIQQGDTMTAVRIVRIGAAAEAFRPDMASFEALRASTPTIPPRHSALPPLFVEGAKIELPDFYPAWLNEKLNHYAHVRGVTLFVRTLPRLTESGDPDEAERFVADLHESLSGREPRAATLVFSAEEKRWRIWLGDGLFGPLGATPGRMAEVKERILSGAAQQLLEGVPRRSIDAAVTDLIEAIDSGEFPVR